MIAYTPRAVQVPLPPHHRFPMGKYALLAQTMQGLGWAVYDAPAAPWAAVEAVHAPVYLQALRRGTLDKQAERKLGLPMSPELLERSLHSVGGTLAAAQQALQSGYGVNLAGGTHHAFAERGEGFCVLNDLVICTHTLLTHHHVRRVLIVDVDVHQGNGTAKLLEHEPRAFTMSVHGRKNYPFHKEKSDLDVPLEDGLDDEAYLTCFEPLWIKVMTEFQPDIVLYQAGVDVLKGDRFGRLSLTRKGVVARDKVVFSYCKQHAVPFVYTIGGGYQGELKHTVAAHAAALQALATIMYS